MERNKSLYSTSLVSLLLSLVTLTCLIATIGDPGTSGSPTRCGNERHQGGGVRMIFLIRKKTDWRRRRRREGTTRRKAGRSEREKSRRGLDLVSMPIWGAGKWVRAYECVLYVDVGEYRKGKVQIWPKVQCAVTECVCVSLHSNYLTIYLSIYLSSCAPHAHNKTITFTYAGHMYMIQCLYGHHSLGWHIRQFCDITPRRGGNTSWQNVIKMKKRGTERDTACSHHHT